MGHGVRGCPLYQLSQKHPRGSSVPRSSVDGDQQAESHVSRHAVLEPLSMS
jgi:hypothetical protein